MRKIFTFIVNGKEFHTNRLIADILSPKISQIHHVDPTISTFIINSKHKGNFSKILNLINFQRNQISKEELPFLSEIIQLLDLNSIEVNFKDVDEKITLTNVFSKINDHENNSIFFRTNLQQEIDFLSSNIYQLKDENLEEFLKICKNSINQVLSNSKLKLKSEDQLLNIVNFLYKKNQEYSYLYKYVSFVNITKNKMKEFIEIFDYNELDGEIWNSISKRLLKDDKNEKENERYEEKVNNKGITISFNGDNEFEGIIDYFRKKTNDNIINEMLITASSIGNSSYPIKNLLNKDTNRKFLTQNTPNSWICFDFKNKKISPTHYSIQTHCGCYLIKNWKLEGSNDNVSWDVIDEQTNCEFTHKSNIIHTFQIRNKSDKKFRYLRIFSTGKNWENYNEIYLSSIEFYGTLI